MRVIQKALTFDDVLLVPAHSTVLPRDVSLKTRLTRKIKLNIPLVSAAMDTVTEARLAIAIAQEGGIGIVHKNLNPKAQAAEVLKVKRFESGVLRDPMTVSPDITVRELLALTQQYKVSGFPVVDQGKVVGIVTNRDYRFETNLDAPVRTIMTPRERLIYVKESASPEEARALLHKHRLERVLVVNDGFALRGLVTVKDILKATEHPLASKDEQGKLRVGAAVGVGEGTEERIEHLVEAGADVIVVDTAHGHAQGVLDRVRWVKKNFPNVEVIGGNIATTSGAKALVDHGADGIKVGIGPGSICTTRVIAGVGVPQISAIQNVYAVMMGSIFAGTEEAPGETILYQGRSYKLYRGMGSLSAMQDGAADRYFQDPANNADKLVAEGIEGRVPYKGSVVSIIFQMVGGLRASMGYCGCATIGDMRTRTDFVQITSAGMRESHVHDVQIVKEAPNYQIE
jgi:IMP dehydrogenase